MLLLTTMERVRRARLPRTRTVANIILSFKQASSSIRPERRKINGQYAKGSNALRGAVSYGRRGRIRGFHSRRPSRKLAYSQQAVPNLATALLLSSDRSCSILGSNCGGTRFAGGARAI